MYHNIKMYLCVYEENKLQISSFLFENYLSPAKGGWIKIWHCPSGRHKLVGAIFQKTITDLYIKHQGCKDLIEEKCTAQEP